MKISKQHFIYDKVEDIPSVLDENTLLQKLIYLKYYYWMFLGYEKKSLWTTGTSSHPQVFCKKAAQKNLAKFTGKH